MLQNVNKIEYFLIICLQLIKIMLDAKAVFDVIKNDKTNWTKSIVLQKVSENWETNENGEEEFIDEEFEIIEVVK